MGMPLLSKIIFYFFVRFSHLYPTLPVTSPELNDNLNDDFGPKKSGARFCEQKLSKEVFFTTDYINGSL